MKVVIVDVDDTMTDASWRFGMSFDESYSRAAEDPPFLDLIEFINAVSDQYWVLGVTTRPERFRATTMNWLLGHGVKLGNLEMRADADFRSEVDIKRDIARKWLPKVVVCAFDDREDVVQMYRDLGITALQIFNRRKTDANTKEHGARAADEAG